MKNVTWVIMLSVLVCAPGLANTDNTKNPNSVKITLGFEGLSESSAALNQALMKLADSMNAISDDPGDLTPEQIQALTGLVNQSNTLLKTLNTTMSGLAPAIESLEEPSRRIVSNWASALHVETIDPAIASIDRKVSVWIRIVMIALIIMLIVAGIGIYFATSQLRQMSANLRQIAGDYRIVRVEDLDKSRRAISQE